MQLDFNKTRELLKKYRIPYSAVLCKKADDAVNEAKKLGFPVVLKISSMDIIHKTEVAGVRLGINNEEELKLAYEEMLKDVKRKKPKAKVQGIIIQKQKTGKELIIGAKRDSQFGPVVMFGVGGIFVELIKDVSFRIAPIDKETAKEMIEEIKLYPLLKGVRGEKPVCMNDLIDMLVQTSKLIVNEEKITEVDFNPVFADHRTAEAVDARIIQ
jgi:acetyl-CoA synthetase (ADP-forming)